MEKCVYKIQIHLQDDTEYNKLAEFFIEDFDGNIKAVEKIAKIIKRFFVGVKTVFSSKVDLKFKDNIIVLYIDICKEKVVGSPEKKEPS